MSSFTDVTGSEGCTIRANELVAIIETGAKSFRTWNGSPG